MAELNVSLRITFLTLSLSYNIFIHGINEISYFLFISPLRKIIITVHIGHNTVALLTSTQFIYIFSC